MNCLTLVHIFLEEVCGLYGLPKENNQFTGAYYYQRCQPVELGRIVQGDIFLFGRADFDADDQEQLHGLHLAVFTGFSDENGEPVLIHATNVSKSGSVHCWPLSKFAKYTRYRILVGIRRAYLLSEKHPPHRTEEVEYKLDAVVAQ